MSGSARCKSIEINSVDGNDYVISATNGEFSIASKDPVTSLETPVITNAGGVTTVIGNFTVTNGWAIYGHELTDLQDWTSWVPSIQSSNARNLNIRTAKYMVINKLVTIQLDADVHVGPLANWRFENSAADDGPNAYTGTLRGTSTYDSTVANVGARSLKVVDSTGGFEINYAALKTALASNFTISCRFYTTDNATQNQVLLSVGNLTFHLAYNYNGNGKLCFFDRGDAISYTSATWTPVANKWYHVIVVRQNGLVSMYAALTATEWASFSSLAVSNNPGGTVQAPSGTLRIGQRSGTSEFMNGYLDDFAIYDSALPSDFLTRLAGKSASATGVYSVSLSLPGGMTPANVASSRFTGTKTTGTNLLHSWVTENSGLVFYVNNEVALRGNAAAESVIDPSAGSVMTIRTEHLLPGTWTLRGNVTFLKT
eukprot:jgi/Mesvir1/26926/Mv20653-RA.1